MRIERGTQRISRSLIILSAVLLVATMSSLAQNDETSSEACTTGSWDMYNKKDYSGAAKKARSCIYFFQGKANDQEKDMSGKPSPPLGDITPDQRAEIVKRGQLNDVATCYFIIGGSYERIYLRKIEGGSGGAGADKDKSTAIDAYQAACKYKYARTLAKDLKSVWSPAQESSYALERLGSQCP